MLPRSEPTTAPREPGGFVRVRLDVAYDGSEFKGWAQQPNLRTVEGTLMAGFARILRTDEPIQLTVAGRTDTGVHARGQVVQIDIPQASWRKLPGRGSHSPETALARRLGGVLPADVVVQRVTQAPAGFDARFSALSRSYRYLLSDQLTTRVPTRRAEVVWLKEEKLNVDAMHQAGQLMLGEHDWLPYCRPREGASTIRTLLDFSWVRQNDGLIAGHVTADAFCHHMVRALVGGALLVGQGKKPPTWPREVLALGQKCSAITVMPPHGLTLMSVAYPDDADLADQAVKTRRYRGTTPQQ